LSVVSHENAVVGAVDSARVKVALQLPSRKWPVVARWYPVVLSVAKRAGMPNRAMAAHPSVRCWEVVAEALAGYNLIHPVPRASPQLSSARTRHRCFLSLPILPTITHHHNTLHSTQHSTRPSRPCPASPRLCCITALGRLIACTSATN
jgi:hypothetical protein